MKNITTALSALFFALAATAQIPLTSPPTGPLNAIAALDVPRYMGTWYEIAKYPNRFQKQCVAETTADYQLQAGGAVQVTNRCRTASGVVEEAIGAARQVGPATSSPQLQVRFAPSWLSWLFMVWGNYWVIDLDPAYQLVAVSEPKREYLWVLSRTPTVNAEAYAALMTRLQAQGLDPTRLERTRQAP
jgi:apolipoprotein D and lipocalin family protein